MSGTARGGGKGTYAVADGISNSDSFVVMVGVTGGAKFDGKITIVVVDGITIVAV